MTMMTVRVTASLRSVAYACDMVEPSFCELVCFGSDFDHDGFCSKFVFN